MTQPDLALGALYGLALGDALGMPTQSFSRGQIQARFGRITTLENAPADQPIAPNMPAGSITDDTEQAILVGQLLVGSQDLLGPSTKRAIEMILAGHSPTESGRYGTTNGAAMRIAPVGIASDINQPERFIHCVVQACQVTHNTSLGIASAAAVAAVVSSGLNGTQLEHALNAGTEMAFMAEHHGHWVAGGRIGPRIRWARQASRECNPDNIGDLLYDVIGTSVASQESVVAAFALAQRVASGSLSSFDALCMAASIGGDTDTIAAILGAMLGACGGLQLWPATLIKQIVAVNSMQLDPLVRDLLALRHS